MSFPRLIMPTRAEVTALYAVAGFHNGARRHLHLFGRDDVDIGFASGMLAELHPGRAGRDFTSAQLADSVRRVIQFWDARPTK
jgi:hypothetical protein